MIGAGRRRNPPAMVIQPHSRGRYLIVAMTRCGKTVLATRLSQGFAGPAVSPNHLVVILDSKREPSLARLVPEESRSIPFDRGGWCRVCPPDGEAAEPYLRQVFQRGNVWLWIDELPMVGNAHKAPRHLELIYRQGAVRNIGVLALSQDPVDIPKIAKSQSEWRFIGPNGETDYVEACAKLIHQDPRAIGQRIATMPKYRFLAWSFDHGRDMRPPDEVFVRL